MDGLILPVKEASLVEEGSVRLIFAGVFSSESSGNSTR